jgi:hypothetical protein
LNPDLLDLVGQAIILPLEKSQITDGLIADGVDWGSGFQGKHLLGSSGDGQCYVLNSTVIFPHQL